MRYLTLFLLVFILGCRMQTTTKDINRMDRFRELIDVMGRKVIIPDSVSRVVCIRSSAIRLVTYAGGASRICGVEEQETRSNQYTHLYAYPNLAKLAVIGPVMGGDAELILSVHPDVIFMSTTTIEDANALQDKLRIPVITLDYGDMGRKRTRFYQSLHCIGDVLGTKPHVDSLITYIDYQIDELRHRTEKVKCKERVYVGGIAYRGIKGLISTDPYYAALEYLNIYNVASEIDSTYVSAIAGTYIDWEKLLDWNPDVIFVDALGIDMVKEELMKKKKVCQFLDSYRNKRIYTLWPYNNYHSNFDVMIINAWYVGKTLYPKQFDDIVFKDKANEVMTRFVGHTIADSLIMAWKEPHNIFNE